MRLVDAAARYDLEARSSGRCHGKSVRQRRKGQVNRAFSLYRHLSLPGARRLLRRVRHLLLLASRVPRLPRLLLGLRLRLQLLLRLASLRCGAGCHISSFQCCLSVTRGCAIPLKTTTVASGPPIRHADRSRRLTRSRRSSDRDAAPQRGCPTCSTESAKILNYVFKTTTQSAQILSRYLTLEAE
jgi:hypothetical protein